MFQSPGTTTPTGVLAQPSQVSPPAVLPPAPQPPVKQRRIRMLLIALLVVAVVGSGLLLSFFALNRTTTPSTPPLSPSNSVVGQVQFLSSPNAPQGSLDEVKITLQHIPNAPAGEHYYAWLQINSESLLPIHWPLTTQNGGISSLYHKADLLTNKPYLLLITVEKVNADPQAATFAPGARLYYAILPTTIQNSAPFDIRPCPNGGTTGICMS